MKLYKLSLCVLAGVVVTSCSDIDDLEPQSGSITAAQLQATNTAIPERVAATFSGMFTMMGQPNFTFGSSNRADDFGFIASAISLDAEGPDFTFPNSGYNWFSPCGEYSSRNADYANPYLRYKMPYSQIKIVNDIITSYPADVTDPAIIYQIAQAKAMRAFDYMAIAPYFQFNYVTSKDSLCVPLITETSTYFGRATVGQVYEQVIADLNYAIEHLEGYDRGADKTRINQQVAYGLRARAYLNMGMYKEAAEDAAKALAGYTPASISEVSTPAFCDMNEHNWMWGIYIDKSWLDANSYATASSWVSSFSANGYAAATQCYAYINNLLYDKIPATDVRKGWWVDENLHSPNLANVSWDGVKGDAISTLAIPDVKEAFLPYTNVKFGMKSGVGSEINDSDWPLMRVEEMILVEIEGLAKSGQEGLAKQKLETFVKTYRDPSYTVPSTRALADEIWFQRRVELWGEGFAMSDIKRLGKPVVRFHGSGSNYPDAFQFNIAANDQYLLMRFPQREKDTNYDIIDNEGGAIPVAGQNPNLRDGVTD